MAIAMGAEHTIERLNALLRGHGHRTNDGEFLWRSHFDEAGVLQGIALRLLNRVDRSGEPIYLILDDIQTLKRARKVVANYLRRWAIELLIKDEKQHLGLGAYRVLRDRAVVGHLHLVDCAYACLCVRTQTGLPDPPGHGRPRCTRQREERQCAASSADSPAQSPTAARDME